MYDCRVRSASRLGRNTNGLIGIANAMPEGDYGFKPTPAQESFAERLMHVVNIDLKLLSTLGGKTPVPMINPKASSKADVMAALKQWDAYRRCGAEGVQRSAAQ
jgi:hypothetical protein